MGVATSSEALSRERQLIFNQELWNKERKVENIRLFVNQLRKGKDEVKINNNGKQHRVLLKKIEERNNQQKKKLEIETQKNKKILSDDKHFKAYFNKMLSGKNSKSLEPIARIYKTNE